MSLKVTQLGGGKQIELEEKTVTASTVAVTVLPTEGKAISKVIVNPTPTETKIVIPAATEQIIMPTAGKHLSMVTVNGDTDLIPENIAAGKNIFNVLGSVKKADAAVGSFSLTSYFHAPYSEEGWYTPIDLKDAPFPVINHNLGFIPEHIAMFYVGLCTEFPTNGSSNGEDYLFLAAVDNDFRRILGSGEGSSILSKEGYVTITSMSDQIRWVKSNKDARVEIYCEPTYYSHKGIKFISGTYYWTAWS